ncbi:PLP-dependent aspartate aminotransferase family protein [Psychrobium sp. 1_MG-2023]|uniref:trans-sulfuration enzyme family protein n=1 Tax=Psychrobium sp. 1_MG-2023 TaxID=3062624 RepID=UPI000C31C38B|nr:aminotransferase class I/II-fold pyridoxal phosphate-dependent enzyme [Psychrobium sp. 1_MG-2023]MDP2562687.1 aminotransferase class I/II-fold pyridoxal phosphate-dependent enzyme [Psychrobium sp. 1_MG-2023]PKF54800.1 methionine gamma-lyase [Alteromonadales bacterium alter-6D02]
MKQKQHFDTQAIHSGNATQPYGCLTTPIYQTSTFTFDSVEQGANRFSGEEAGYIYSRLGNPTTRELELKMADLELCDDAIATASGMGAVSATLLANLSCGDHLIASQAVYGCTYSLLTEQLVRFGIEVTLVDMADKQQVLSAVRENTKVIFLETPVNPHLAVYDLTFIAQLAKEHQLLSVVDNTFMTPYLQQPAKFGIDVIVHSATKYLNGHGDVIAGIICSSSEQIELIASTMIKDIGAVLGPFDAWLILRGLKTLSVRMERHCTNGLAIAQWLEKQPAVNKVYYPGLDSHPGNHFIPEQMTQGGGVIAFTLNAELEQVKGFVNALSLFKIAVSLGDAESLIQHPASMTHATYSDEDKKTAGITDSLLRISVGLEHSDDLINDLDHALVGLSN